MATNAFGDRQVVGRKTYDPINHLIGVVARLVLPDNNAEGFKDDLAALCVK